VRVLLEAGNRWQASYFIFNTKSGFSNQPVLDFGSINQFINEIQAKKRLNWALAHAGCLL
jgi:hypothetical protein